MLVMIIIRIIRTIINISPFSVGMILKQAVVFAKVIS